MGGSSLGPEVLAETFGQKRAFRNCACWTPPIPRRSRRSKLRSSSTRRCSSSRANPAAPLSPNVLMDYFFDRAPARQGQGGQRFVAVTDPGSSLEKVATERGFAHIFHGEPTIGGRYSVLSPFGLVPAAAHGDRCRANFSATRRRWCAPAVPMCRRRRIPACSSALALGAAAKHGRDKVTIIASQGIADFGAWLEQLIAESTGKNGKGIIPLEGEPLGDAGRLRQGSRVHRSAPEGKTMPTHAERARCAGGGRPSGRAHRRERVRRISARSFSAGRSRPRWRAPSSASIRSTSPTSKRPRSRRAN